MVFVSWNEFLSGLEEQISDCWGFSGVSSFVVFFLSQRLAWIASMEVPFLFLNRGGSFGFKFMLLFVSGLDAELLFLLIAFSESPAVWLYTAEFCVVS